MSEFREGDRVRVVAKAPDSGSVDSTVDAWGSYFGKAAVDLGNATVELVDDPSKDPVGTVRENTGTFGGSYVRIPDRGFIGAADQPWVLMDPVNGFRTSSRNDSLGPIIGAVPGTPAAERQAADEEPRELWTGDGRVEPPAHVKVVRDRDGDLIVRVDGGWLDAGDDGAVSSWHEIYDVMGYAPYTEVRS